MKNEAILMEYNFPPKYKQFYIIIRKIHMLQIMNDNLSIAYNNVHYTCCFLYKHSMLIIEKCGVYDYIR